MRVNLNIFVELDGTSSDRCETIKAALDSGGIPVQLSNNILAMMWGKFYGFAAGATIATLTRSRAGVIARSASGAKFVADVIEECRSVVTAAGYPPLPPPAPDTAAIMRGLFSQPDSSYGPSMLIDMEDGRPAESDHTIGDMVRHAECAGIHAPILNAALCNLQDARYGRRDGLGRPGEIFIVLGPPGAKSNLRHLTK